MKKRKVRLMDKFKAFVMRHRLTATLTSIILVATGLVSISMVIYYQSGAFQLDLSRPEYKSVRSQIDTDTKTTDNFDSQGAISKEVLEEFLTKYKDRANSIFEAEAFSNDVLSDEQLRLNESQP